jgi:hypothetical protein
MKEYRELLVTYTHSCSKSTRSGKIQKRLHDNYAGNKEEKTEMNKKNRRASEKNNTLSKTKNQEGMRKQQQQQRKAKHWGQSGDEEVKDERREKMGFGTKEEVRRKIFSWRGHYLYAWAGRKDSDGKEKGKKKCKFCNFLPFFLFSFASQFDPVFF